MLLIVASTALAGCGSSSSGVGGSRLPTGHHVSVIRAAICGYTAYRAVHDLRNHHRFAAAFNAYLAVHNCRRIRH
ncbi:MAG: hypothetical protein ACR2QA_02570 [Solirubrobacteraceae bacterium]